MKFKKRTEGQSRVRGEMVGSIKKKKKRNRNRRNPIIERQGVPGEKVENYCRKGDRGGGRGLGGGGGGAEHCPFL